MKSARLRWTIATIVILLLIGVFILTTIGGPSRQDLEKNILAVEGEGRSVFYLETGDDRVFGAVAFPANSVFSRDDISYWIAVKPFSGVGGYRNVISGRFSDFDYLSYDAGERGTLLFSANSQSIAKAVLTDESAVETVIQVDPDTPFVIHCRANCKAVFYNIDGEMVSTGHVMEL